MDKIKHLMPIIFALIIGPAPGLEPARAGDFFEEPGAAIIAKHQRTPGGRKLQTQKKTFRDNNTGKTFTLPQTILQFTLVRSALPRGAGTYDGKPNCVKRDIRRNPVLYDSEELDMFDIVYYNPGDPQQVKQAAQRRGSTEPYLVGDIVNPHRTKSTQQELGRFFDIRCLPTRIHYSYRESRRYEEYREGELAWDEDTPGPEIPAEPPYSRARLR